MNKDNRKTLSEALGMLKTANDLLEPLAEGEQEKFDNMSEGLQQGEKGQAIEAAADALASAVSFLNDAIDRLEGIE